ncbi:hypothetical protein MMC10_002181 [Thelotrema lepadinum]|nr:hypothetical protein [Thelotrema lepadinum]
MAPSYKFLTLEEHFVSPYFASDYDSNPFGEGFGDVYTRITDLGDGRIADMDAGSVSRQVISHSPALTYPSSDACRKGNDYLYEAIKAHPDRYSGFAILPMGEPRIAAAELERCVKEMHFVGALIGNHVNGRFFDAEFFWPVFEKAQELDVPIYIHPTTPTPQASKYYEGNFSQAAAFGMSTYGWSWYTEVALHVLRLVSSGLFDRFPRFKLVIGHMGEGLPFQLARLLESSEPWVKLQRGWKQVWDENIWITTSGTFSVDPMACILRNTKIDHILYSVDTPFYPSSRGQEFMEKLERSGLVTEEQFRKIAYENAEKLLKVKV